MKIRTSSLIVAVALVGCNDNHPPQPQYQQQYQQPMAQYPQQMQPQVVQPQVIQAPAQPVVVQQQQDNTLTNMALGAVIGHTIANLGCNNYPRPSDRVVEHKTVIIDNRQPINTVVPVSSAPVSAIAPPSAPVQQKTSAMDMNKLSASTNQTFNTSGAAPAPSLPKPSSMDMSKLSSSRPTVSLAKPSSSMNMSKLGRR
jgi:hypothetical protein